MFSALEYSIWVYAQHLFACYTIVKNGAFFNHIHAIRVTLHMVISNYIHITNLHTISSQQFAVGNKWPDLSAFVLAGQSVK
jgi:hypothetical protein